MLPILYPANAAISDFGKNGLGFIRLCSRAIVSEERNGSYELALDMLPQDRLAKQIVPGNFIKCKANPYDDPQIFEIYKKTYTESVTSINAQHIRYINDNNVIGTTIVSNRQLTPTEWWNEARRYLEIPSLWTFTSDIDTQASVTAARDQIIRLGDFLKGTEGSLLDVFKGEYHYDNFNIAYNRRRGQDTGICLRYGSGISTYEQELDGSTVYSHVYPYATVGMRNDSGSDVGTYHLEGDLINLNNTNQTYKRVLSYDFTEKFVNDVAISYESGPGIQNLAALQQKLANVAQNYVNSNMDALLYPSVNITVDVDSALDLLQGCQLCDTVLVYIEPLDYSARLKIIKTEYDVLAQRYVKMELGYAKKTLTGLLNTTNIGGA